MFRNYFKIAFRNLWKSKGFSSLNIAGLAIGMAGAILISLWITNEISYDRFHKNTANIYEVWNRAIVDNKLQCWESTPKPLGPAMKLQFGEVAAQTRVSGRWFVTRYKDVKVSSQAMIADPAFLTMFSFPLVKGNPENALDDVYSILVTENFAKKMFGNEEPVNKVIQIDSNNFTVRGVLKNLPNNTAFACEFMLPWAYMKLTNQDDDNWGNNSVQNFVQLKPGVNAAVFGEKLKNFTIKNSNGQEKQELFLHPLSKIHLYSRFENGKVVGGRIETVRMFIIIAAFILIIACINFMNLSTARSEKRAREVGIRKIAGANKPRLIGQFLGESTLIALLAGIIALGIVQLSLPSFNLLISKQLSVPFGSVAFWSSAVLFVLSTGIIAGSYPAFFLSSFNPISVLKGTFKKVHAVVNPRRILVVIQFTFAITLIICTIIIVQQMKHGQEREVGYDRGQLVYHWLSGDLYEKFPLVKNELLSSGVATSVTRTNSLMTTSFSNTWGFVWDGKDPNDRTVFDNFTQDEGIIKTMGLKLIDGRDFDLAKFPTDSNAMLLNESAAKAMKIDQARSQLITIGPYKFHVVGIFKDFILGSPFDRIGPMVVYGAINNWFNIIHIRFNPANTTASNLATMEKIFRKYNPNYPFEYHFTDQDYAAKFGETERTATLTGLFAGLTILISCLGLFGLAAYMAENRIREIGIRKVLGASVLKIASLLSKDFLMLVVIALIIAAPIAWYAMSTWLEDYSYRVKIEWWVFAGAGLLSVLISLLTVSYQAIRAALANPVKSLRSE